MARIEWVKEIAKSDEKEVKGKRQKKITKVKKDKASKNENLSAKR